MPYKTEKIKLPRELDRRVKLTDQERMQVKADRASGMTLKAIAEAFNVSKSLISFIVNPASVERNKLRREERGGWKRYYDKKKHAKRVNEHRLYKHKVLGDPSNNPPS